MPILSLGECISQVRQYCSLVSRSVNFPSEHLAVVPPAYVYLLELHRLWRTPTVAADGIQVGGFPIRPSATCTACAAIPRPIHHFSPLFSTSSTCLHPAPSNASVNGELIPFMEGGAPRTITASRHGSRVFVLPNPVQTLTTCNSQACSSRECIQCSALDGLLQTVYVVHPIMEHPRMLSSLYRIRS